MEFKQGRLGFNPYGEVCCFDCQQKLLNSLESKEKAGNTNLEKYGSKEYFSTQSFKKSNRKTLQEKYNIDHISQNSNVVKKSNNTKINTVEQFEKENNCTQVSKLLKRYRTAWYYAGIGKPYLENKGILYVKNEIIPEIEKYISEYHFGCGISKPEQNLFNFIKSIYNGIIIQHSREIISPKELDIYLPEKRLAIEYNGGYWHSSQNIEKDYHLNKSLACREKKIRLIHIYSFEDLEKQKQLLKDLICNSIDNYPKNDFNKNNLIQSIPQSKIINIYNNKIVYGAGKLYV